MNIMQQKVFAGLQLITAPTTEPADLSLSQVQAFMVIDSDGGGPRDMLLTSFITMCRKHVEQAHLRRAFLSQTYKLSLMNWPGRDYQNWPQAFSSRIDQYYNTNSIDLPFAPLQSVTSVQYMTSDGATKSMSDAGFTTSVPNGYNVLTTIEPGRIVLPYAQVWPTDILMPGAPITITYVAGFADDADLQAWEGWDISLQAIRMLIVDMWENRIAVDQSVLNKVVSDMLGPYRIYH